MFGGPSNAQNITTIRPFSRRCAGVSRPSRCSQVGDAVRPEHRERPGHALGRDVHMTVRGERRGADEEHRLREDERRQPVGDLCVHGGHEGSLAPVWAGVGIVRWMSTRTAPDHDPKATLLRYLSRERDALLAKAEG